MTSIEPGGTTEDEMRIKQNVFMTRRVKEEGNIHKRRDKEDVISMKGETKKRARKIKLLQWTAKIISFHANGCVLASSWIADVKLVERRGKRANHLEVDTLRLPAAYLGLVTNY